MQEAANCVTTAQHRVKAAHGSVVDYPYTGGWLAQRRYERAMGTKNAAVAAAEQALRAAETAEANARDAHTQAVEQQ
jgi:hypothetical protein